MKKKKHDTPIQPEQKLSAEEIRRFRSIILMYYKKHGRDLPWRNTENPYHILVSEIMLQQTQVNRVLEKYGQFIQRFPDFTALNNALLKDVLAAWQGLGYNRRAIALKKTASIIMNEHKGTIPADREKLMQLPGIGKATAGSIMAFVYRMPGIIIETNIRSVFIHFFFQGKTGVPDADIEPLVALTLDKRNPRDWYYALMDYGVYLKKKHPRITGKSAAYKKQSRFSGSDRQIRGKILRILAHEEQVHEKALLAQINDDRAERIIETLVQEGFIEAREDVYSLKE